MQVRLLSLDPPAGCSVCKNPVLVSLIIILLAFLNCPWAGCLRDVDWWLKMSYSLPWMSAFHPRLRNSELGERRHFTANNSLWFPLVPAPPWPPRQWWTEAALGVDGYLVGTDSMLSGPFQNISEWYLSSLWRPQKVGHKGRAWVSHRGQVGAHGQDHVLSATLPFFPRFPPCPSLVVTRGPPRGFRFN